jgi:dihydrofolate reductase
MTRFVYVTATTLDGFLADDEDSLDWLFTGEGGDDAIAEDQQFMQSATVQVMGSSTFRWILEHEDLVAQPGKWQEFYPGKATFVFSSRTDLPVLEGADVRVVSGPVAEHVEAILAAADGGDVHLVGGGDLVAAFDDAGRLDGLQVSIAPVTLGSGKPLLGKRLDSSRLRLVSVRQTGQFVQATYDVRPADPAGLYP